MACEKQIVVVFDIYDKDMNEEQFKQFCKAISVFIEHRLFSGCRVYKMPVQDPTELFYVNHAELKGRLTGMEKFTQN